jgi:hypothetical protein
VIIIDDNYPLTFFKKRPSSIPSSAKLQYASLEDFDAYDVLIDI